VRYSSAGADHPVARAGLAGAREERAMPFRQREVKIWSVRERNAHARITEALPAASFVLQRLSWEAGASWA